jgi:hypothetical protein
VAKQAAMAGNGDAAVVASGTAGAPLSIEEFGRVDLRIARIESAELVDGADKLLKLGVDLGGEKRTIFAGIRSAYTPDAGRSADRRRGKYARDAFRAPEGMVLAAGRRRDFLFAGCGRRMRRSSPATGPMSELLLLALGASLVNNFVLTNFLGLCPFVGVSRRFEAAAGMALATLFVLTIASGLSFVVWHWIFSRYGVLRTLAFILLIAGVVQFTERR